VQRVNPTGTAACEGSQEAKPGQVASLRIRARVRVREDRNSTSCKVPGTEDAADESGSAVLNTDGRIVREAYESVLARLLDPDPPLPESAAARPPGEPRLVAWLRQRVAGALSAAGEANWGWWWDRVVRTLVRHPRGMDMLEDLLHEVTRARNPVTAHEHGIRDPGAWMGAKVREWARENGVELPAMVRPMEDAS